MIIQFQPFFEPVENHKFPFFFFDDRSYHSHSVKIAERWAKGERPILWIEDEIGTLQTGYYKFVSGIYYLLGPKPIFPLLLNPLFGAILCILIFKLAEQILDFESAKKSLILTTLNPIFWYWSSFFLKDTLLTTFFVLSIILYLEYRKTNHPICFFALLLTGYFLALIRIPSLVVIIITAFIFEFLVSPPLLSGYRIGSSKKWYFVLTICIGIIIALVARFFEIFRDVEGQIIYSFLNALPDSGATVLGSFKHLISGIPRFCLAPYGWVFGNYFTCSYFLYPGQWFLYLYLLPFAFSGVGNIIKENRYNALWLILPIIFKGYFYLLIFRGSAPRHILELMPLITILAGWGLKHPLSKKFMLFYFGLFLLFMLLQFGHLVFGR